MRYQNGFEDANGNLSPVFGKSAITIPLISLIIVSIKNYRKTRKLVDFCHITRVKL
jgi:hypothetical protein